MESVMRGVERLMRLLEKPAITHSSRGCSVSGGTRPGDGSSDLSVWVDSSETRQRVEMYIVPVVRDGVPELAIHFFEGTPVEVARAKMEVMKARR